MPRTLAVLGAALWLLAACQGAPTPTRQPAAASPTADASQTPEVARLLAAARDAGENELDLSWSDNTLGGSQGAQRLAVLFNQTYGTSIQVNFTPGPTMTEMSSRVSQEVATGRKSETDLLLGGETHYAPLLDRDVLERYDYTQLSPRITPEIVAPNNVGVEVATRLPGITYNTNLVPPADAPHTLEDALNPKWRDIMASTQNAANFDRVAARPEWGPERMKRYVARLSGNISGLVRCGETARFMSGEFGMLVMDCGGYEVHKGQAKGGPVGHVIPEDAPVIAVFYLGVPRTAAHPNLAKLFVNLLLSEAGQRALYETEYLDHVSLPGSQSAAELNDVRAKGITPLKVDARFVAEHPELEGLSEELTALLRDHR
ncbi:MAG TPA: ABC transporter substrate-binding protein [Chloroflexota bacterium]|nr:ABC transporter substrate-binding protein [Chloroflexota bacterium]